MASEPAVSGAEGPEEHERIDVEAMPASDLLAATHLHRYELAAALLDGSRRILDLCCGTGYGSRLLAAGTGAAVHGVDVAADAIAAAERAPAPADGGAVSFERADAVEYLRARGAGEFDAIVCFEGMEHVPDPGAVAAELARLAGGGARLVLSFPNSKGFEERNRFHVTDFGWEETRALIERFDAPTVFEQYLAEGSVVVPAGERPQAAPARLVGEPGPDAPAWAGHWIVAVGVDPERARTAAARLAVAAAPHQNHYMRQLERSNGDLRRANARLARAHLGVHDAAAASMVRRLEEMERRAEAAEADARKWNDIADNNDHARQLLQIELGKLEERLASPRYATIDAIHARLSAIPGGERLMRRAGSLRRGRS